MKYRLYFFVPYNISEIQKGIQAGHAALEYAYAYGDNEDYEHFIKHDKTWIVLNGGTTRGETFSKDYFDGLGSINQIANSLEENGIKYSKFYEPDLNFALTAVCFLADERVWDFEKYPEFENCLLDLRMYEAMYGKSKFTRENLIEKYPEEYNNWVKALGGYENVFLRSIIKDKRLA